MGKDNFFNFNRSVSNFTSNADLTANRFKASKIFGSLTVGQVSATTDVIIGIQENIPLSGTATSVRVCTGGQTLGIAGGAFTAGALLTIDANGQFTAANTTTQITVGYSIDSASAASEVVGIIVNVNNSALPA